jgi:glycosyltransferase involved in cell wall biosynthesis
MTKHQKIAINGTYIQEQASGLGVVNSNLITQLMNSEQEFDFILYSNSSYFQKNYLSQTISVTDSLSPDRGFSGHINRFLWYQTLLNWQLKQQNTALFYSPVGEGMLFPSIPQVVSVYDVIPIKYPELNPKWKYYYYYILPLILKKSEAIICCSEHTKKDLIENYKLSSESIHVVYPGFDRNLFRPQADLEILSKYNLDKYLLYVGDMRFYKNLARCLEAFDRLPLKDYQFVITGKKDDFFYPEIKQKTEQLAAKDRIIFLDYVPIADLPGLYSMAQALVFASLYEGFGLPVLEAMACGCPVIASKVTSIPEVGGDALLYVDPYDVESITQGMYQVLSNEHLRIKLSNQGLERAELFSWSQMGKDTLQIFADCLNK